MTTRIRGRVARLAHPLLLAILTLLAAGAAADPAAADTSSCQTGTHPTFTATGAEQCWVVPAGLAGARIVATGAAGSNAPTSIGEPALGGRGAVVTGNVTVSPGDVLYVNVGSPANQNNGGFNGGGSGPYVNSFAYSGGGGGASDVRRCSRTTCDLDSSDTRIIVAGGGGGGASVGCLQFYGRDIPDGGDAGSPGHASCNANYHGGAAGGGARGQGGNGTTGDSSGTLAGGGGGGGLFGGGGGASAGGGGGTNLVPAGGSSRIDTSGTPGVTITGLGITASSVHVAVSPATVVADGIAHATVTATVTDTDGNPVVGQAVGFSSDGSQSFGPVTDQGDGTYTATVTASTDQGSATITATDTTPATPITGSATLQQTSATVSVSLSPSSIVADGSATTTATATVEDPSGGGVPGDTVHFSSDGAQGIGPVTDHGDGTYTATITSTTALGDATITARDDSLAPAVSDTATLTQTLGPVTAVSLTFDHPGVAADGHSTVDATATVHDGGGHALTGESVAFSSTDSGQSFGSVTDNGDGTYTTTITASNTTGQPRITATDNSVSGSAVLGQCTTTPHPSFGPTGAEVCWIVPSGATGAHVVVTGAPGGASYSSPGGRGATVSGRLAVSPGDVLFANVGGPGDYFQAGYNGGGNGSYPGTSGGGASDLRTCPAAQCALTATDTRLVVAAGGGGAGFDYSGTDSPGGDAGAPGGGQYSFYGGWPGAGPIGQGSAGQYGGGGGGGGLRGGGGGYNSAGGGGGTDLVPAGGSRSLDDTGSPAIRIATLGGSAAALSVDVQPSSIPANGTSTTTVTATVTDADGLYVAGDDVHFDSDGAQTIGAVTDHGDGTYSATVRSTRSAGTAHITATDRSASPALTDSADLTQNADDPAAVAVSLSPSSLTADGTSTTTATATVTDQAGHRVAGDDVHFSSDGAQAIGPVTDNGDGTYTATITAGTTAGQATITASDGAVDPAVTGTAALTQTPGPATQVSVALSPASIVADGTSTSAMTATVTDAHGNPVSGDNVTFASSGAQVIGTVTAGSAPGTYRAVVTSTTHSGNATLTATDTSPASNPSGSAELHQVPGPADSVDVELGPASITGDGHATTLATATVTDAHGNPVSGDDLSFDSSGAQHVAPLGAGTSPGTYVARITATASPGSPTITATDASVDPHVSGQATLTQTKDRSAYVAVTLSPRSIVADGRSTAVATATVTDLDGYPVSDNTLTFSSSGDQAIGPVTAGPSPGTYQATITSTRTAGDAAITATDTTASQHPSAWAVLHQVAGPATRVTVALSRTTLPADGRTTATATATATDASGNLVSGDNVTFAGFGGQHVGPVRPGSRAGTYVARFTATATPGQSGIRATDSSATPAVKGTAQFVQNDVSSPVVRITTPIVSGLFQQGQIVRADYSCTDTDGDRDVASCVGTVADGARLPTSQVGRHTFQVRAADRAGNRTTVTVYYAVGYRPPAARIACRAGTCSVAYDRAGRPSIAATLSRGGVTYARGTAAGGHALRLAAVRTIRSGDYVLTRMSTRGSGTERESLPVRVTVTP